MLAEAEKYDAFIHKYRKQWRLKHPNETAKCHHICKTQRKSTHWYGKSYDPNEWACLQLIRSPLDRDIHTMRTSIRHKFPELRQQVIINKSRNSNITTTTIDTASFADFLQALVQRAAADIGRPRVTSPLDDHFMPQSTYTCRTDDLDDGSIYYIPIEAIHPALELLYRETRVQLNATGLTSGHYVTKETVSNADSYDIANGSTASASSPLPDLSHAPFALASGRSLPYDAYFQNTTVNRLLCRLYCNDIILYRDVCSADWLTSSSHTY